MEQSGVFISGFPRAGTTMLCLIMNYFENCDVHSNFERHPDDFYRLETDKKYLVIKQPFGVKEFTPLYTYRSLITDHGCKIISLLRDPRDVAVSRHAIAPSIYWVSLGIIIRNCEEYLKNINNKNVLFIRYEDLVTDTENELNKISNFLDCSYSNDFENFYTLDDAKLEKNKSLGTLRKIDSDSIGQWKREEHKERIKSIVTPELREYIKKLGY